MGVNFSAMDTTDTRSELGARFDTVWNVNHIPVVLRARVAWAHDWVSNSSVTAAFQIAPGASFIVNAQLCPSDLAWQPGSGSRLPQLVAGGKVRRPICQFLADLSRRRNAALHLVGARRRSLPCLLQPVERETGDSGRCFPRYGKHATDIDFAKHVGVLTRSSARAVEKVGIPNDGERGASISEPPIICGVHSISIFVRSAAKARASGPCMMRGPDCAAGESGPPVRGAINALMS